jgi:hypothetical protein
VPIQHLFRVGPLWSLAIIIHQRIAQSASETTEIVIDIGRIILTNWCSSKAWTLKRFNVLDELISRVHKQFFYLVLLDTNKPVEIL